MAPQHKRGRVILRRWDDNSGLYETEVDFATVDDLFALCLQTQYPLLVDRVIIEGVDDKGQPHTATLIFQSVTVSSGH